MIYEYECAEHDGIVSVERKMSDVEVVPTCPTCSVQLRRVWNSPGIKFNAPGFYSTDNKK